MRKLVTVHQLKMEPKAIPGADNIEMVTVQGWECVVKKGEFTVGDYGCYFEIDSFLDTSDPRFSFLEKEAREWQGKRGAVLRTRKLRGQISQGLFLPLDIFPELQKGRSFLGIPIEKHPEKLLDLDFAEDLNVYKYEKESEVIEDRSHWSHKLIRKVVPRKYRVQVFELMRRFFPDERSRGNGKSCGIPSYLRKTDQERVQNLFHKLTPEQRADYYEVTTKLDGSSAQYYVKDGEFGVTSRNLKRGINDGSNFSEIALRYNLPEVLPKLSRNLSICGELMGPKIQGNREGLTQTEFFVFDIWDIDKREYVGKDERFEILAKLRELGVELERVPNLGITTLEKFTDISEILSFAEGASLNHKVREGVVFKKLDGSFSFKCIANSFLLQRKD